MKHLIKHILPKKKSAEEERKDLERTVIEGAEKAVKEHRRVFERLAEYDKARD
jgi:hypothetical protein